MLALHYNFLYDITTRMNFYFYYYHYFSRLTGVLKLMLYLVIVYPAEFVLGADLYIA